MKFSMKKLFLWIFISIIITGCFENSPLGKYSVIDVVNNIGNYQRVYCSDFFSSIELIPLETRDDCLLDTHSRIAVADGFIVKIASEG